MSSLPITLRALEPGDLDMVYRWENDRSLWPAGDTMAPLSRHQIAQYIDNYNADIYADRQLRLMITLGGEATPVGAIDLFDFDPVNSRAAIGIFVDLPYRRRGVALEAVSRLVNHCRRRLSMHSLWCVVASDNKPSLALFKKAGFEVAGTLRSWLKHNGTFSDAYIMQILFS